jgi:arsenate reductase
VTTRVLFVCTGNSCRSQMAEGLLRFMGRDAVEAFSAGTHPKPIHPLAIQSMADLGIDISGQWSKKIDEYLDQDFDFVITVCARAAEECPTWPRAREQIRWHFDDPAAATGTDAQRKTVFRRVREEIRQRISLFLLANRITETGRK